MEIARSMSLLVVAWQAGFAAAAACAPGSSCHASDGDAVGLLQAGYHTKAKLQTLTDTSHWRIQAHPYTNTVHKHCQPDLAELCPDISVESKDFYGRLTCLEKHREQLSAECLGAAFGGTSSQPNSELVSLNLPIASGDSGNISLLEVKAPLFYSNPYSTPTNAKVWFVVILCKVQPAPKGLLFLHTGGPAPSIARDFSMFAEYDSWLEQYDIVSVDQRGMGLSGLELIYGVDTKQIPPELWGPLLDATRSGEIGRGRLSGPAPSGSIRINEQTFMSKCGTLHNANEFNQPTDYGNESQVSDYLDLKMELSTRCMALYERDGGEGRKYNPLQYVGTGALVHDIEWMRLALGAPKISILGFSYGTRLAAAYSAAFPHALRLVVVSGVMAPEPDLLTNVKAAALNVGHILGFLQSECAASGPACTRNPFSVEDAEKPEYVFTGDINAAISELFNRSSRGGGWYRDACGEGHSLSVGQLSSVWAKGLGGKLRSGFMAGFQDSTWPVFFSILPALVFFMLQNPCETAKDHGTTTSGWNVIAVFDLIFALDMTGRWAKEQTLKVMVETARDPTFSPGLHMFEVYANAMYGWRTLPMPIGFSNPNVPTLIAETLYDDATGMDMAQKYKLNFANSVLITAIAGGHCVYPRNTEAWAMMMEFIHTGHRPNDGTITGASPVVPIDFAAGAALAKQHLGGGGGSAAMALLAKD